MLEENLEKNPNIVAWAYIVHDKDVDNDGNLKPPHLHSVSIVKESVK